MSATPGPAVSRAAISGAAASRRAAAAWILVATAAAACAPTGSSSPPVAAPVRAPASPTASPSPGVLSLDFDELGSLSAAGVGSGVLTLTNAGTEPVTVRVSSVGGGTVRSRPDREGGYAARFPAYAPRSRERVVMTATSASVTDPLGPGLSDFTFGMDFAVDTVTAGAGLDNGNNLIQRGLSGDPAQYKLQVDGHRASCLVAGAAGEVIVAAEQVIRPHTWYHVSCSRRGDVVRLELGTFDGSPPERVVETGPTGGLFLPAATPLVLGGKATSTGKTVAGDSDQFNGTMDNVFLQIDEDS